MDAVRVIDFLEKAEPGYYAVIALKNPTKVSIKRAWYKRREEVQIDYSLMPILFWANMYMAQYSEEGEGRSHSVIAPMVRYMDGIEVAPVIDGYVGIMTPHDEDVATIPNIRNAIDAWKTQSKEESEAVNDQKRLMN
jgi:hypothetical protein